MTDKKRVLRDSDAATFKITLSGRRASKLNELAKEAGVTPEELLQNSVEGWLSTGEDFDRAAAYVLNKNADLYRRLS
jgi:antitoxin FitA